MLVEDLDEAAKRAVSMGATVIAGPADGPASASVTIADPGGARLGRDPAAGRPGSQWLGNQEVSHGLRRGPGQPG
ncbi:MAG: VOC family protein [Trebonia sp.]